MGGQDQWPPTAREGQGSDEIARDSFSAWPSASRRDPEEARFPLANDERMSAAEVVRAHGLRNWEEVFHRQGKDDLGLDQCEVRDEQRRAAALSSS